MRLVLLMSLASCLALFFWLDEDGRSFWFSTGSQSVHAQHPSSRAVQAVSKQQKPKPFLSSHKTPANLKQDIAGIGRGLKDVCNSASA